MPSLKLAPGLAGAGETDIRPQNVAGRSGGLRSPRSWVGSLLVTGHGVNDAYAAMLPALLPLLASRFGLTETLLALLVAAFSISSSLPGPFFGALADRLGPRLMTAAGIAFTAFVLSFVGVAPSTEILFAIFLLGGLGSAALHPAGSTLIRKTGLSNPDIAIGLFSAGGMIGYALGPIIVLALVGSFGLAVTPWMMIPGIIAAGLVYALMPDGRLEPAGRRAFRIDAVAIKGPVALLTIVATLAYLPFLAFGSALPLWLVQAQGVAADDALIGLTLAAFSLSGAAGGVALGMLSTRILRQRLVPGAMILALAPLLGVFLTEPASPAYWAAIGLAGALTYGVTPLLVVSAQDLAPRAEAVAAGMVMSFSAGLTALLYVGVGWLQERIGVAPALAMTLAVLAPAAALAFGVLRKHAPARAEQATRTMRDMVCACAAAGPLGVCDCPSAEPSGHCPAARPRASA